MYFESPALFSRHVFESPDLCQSSQTCIIFKHVFEYPDMSVESPALFSRHVFESADMPFESPA